MLSFTCFLLPINLWQRYRGHFYSNTLRFIGVSLWLVTGWYCVVKAFTVPPCWAINVSLRSLRATTRSTHVLMRLPRLTHKSLGIFPSSLPLTSTRSLFIPRALISIGRPSIRYQHYLPLFYPQRHYRRNEYIHDHCSS